MPLATSTRHFIGLMSGTSLDGVDGVLLRMADAGMSVAHACHLDMPDDLRQSLLALNTSGPDELHRSALATNRLMQLYAQAVQHLLAVSGLSPKDVTAVGAHGQTVRHHPPQPPLSGAPGSRANAHTPWSAYTLQLADPALLVELTGIPVVADFRRRDVAAGGQGAPLVPAFHRAMFAVPGERVVVLNIGGMANITVLNPDGTVQGCDTGPGNVLLDMWCERHTGQRMDSDGAWAGRGRVVPELLAAMQQDPCFHKGDGPRSTGRDHFHADWLHARCQGFEHLDSTDVQATLCELTAWSIAKALPKATDRVVVCGGGVFNTTLMDSIKALVAPATVQASDACGLPAMEVEAAAFAWLASQTLNQAPGNVTAVTGAEGPRVLGAIYPA
jgi:anhydro-N-acetylmuramic acid kinase